SRGAVQLLSASKFARLRFGASTPWRPASACPHAAPEVPRPSAELLSGFQRRFRLILLNHLPTSIGDRLVLLLKCEIVILSRVDEITLRRDSYPLEFVQIDFVVQGLELVQEALKLERHFGAEALAAAPAIVVSSLHEADAQMLLCRRIVSDRSRLLHP